MSGLLREHEDIQWFIFRYSKLSAMPYSELGTHYLGGADRELYDHTLRLRVRANAGQVKNKDSPTGIMHVANVAFPRLLTRGGEGLMHGPRIFEQLPDTALNRAKLYISLIAYLAEFPKEKNEVKLCLILPPTLTEHNELRQKMHTGRYPFKPTRKENFNPLQETPTRLLIDYNWKFIDDWLFYAKRHPDYCMGPDWRHRIIDYKH